MYYFIKLPIVETRDMIYLDNVLQFLSTEKAKMEIVSENLFLSFCFILSCFFIFTTVRFRQSSTRSTMLPPGPPRLPLIGNIHQVGKLPHRSFTDLSRTYGPIMHLKFGRLNTVIVTSPEAAREVLKRHDQTLSGRNSPNSIRSINHQNVSVAWIHPSTARWRYSRLSILFLLEFVYFLKSFATKNLDCFDQMHIVVFCGF